MELDLSKIAADLTPQAPAPGAGAAPPQEAAPEAPQESGTPEPEAPVAGEVETPEPVTITSKSITKEGDEYIFRGPEIKDADGKLIGQTVYRGATVDDVINQMAKGKSEADLTISRLRKGKIVDTAKRARTHKVADEPVEEPVQDDDSDLPDNAPDLREIQTKILTEEVKRTGIDTKFLGFKDDDWRKYAEENDLRDFQVMKLINQVDGILKRTAERSSELYQQQSAEFGNVQIIRRETRELAESLEEEGLTIDPEEFKDILDELLSQRGSYDRNGVLISGRITRTVRSYLHKTAKATKPANGTPRPSAKPEGVANRQPIPAGAKSSKGGPAAGAPSQQPPRNLEEGAKSALAFLQSQQKK